MASWVSETRLDVCQTKRNCCSWITNASVVDVHVDLAFDIAKRYWCFFGNWCDLVHHYICRLGDCRSVSYNVVVLAIIYDNVLHSMT